MPTNQPTYGQPANELEEPAEPETAKAPDPRPCRGEVVVRGQDAQGKITLSSAGKPALPAGASVREINVNGDKELELFVRHSCERGSKCPFSVYAACGNGTYAMIPATNLVGDGLETSMQGALVDDVYWRDIVLLQFLTKGDRLGEARTRYRFNGLAYQPHPGQ